jgi:hypothetical protein
LGAGVGALIEEEGFIIRVKTGVRKKARIEKTIDYPPIASLNGHCLDPRSDG